MINRFKAYAKLISKKTNRYSKFEEHGFHYNRKRKLFYIHDYYSKSRFPELYETDINTKKVLKLKNKDPEAIKEYSNKIIEFISIAVPAGKDYAVFCVPSSDKDNKSYMEYCIETIKNNPCMLRKRLICLLEYDNSKPPEI